MNKLLFFPLWKIEDLENYLEEMEYKGYRLENIKYSYLFCFKETAPKKMSYFLSYKTIRRPSMEHWDYALLSRHNANEIKSKMCFFTMYRTKEHKYDLSLLFEGRLDFIKRIILEKALTAMCLTLLFLIVFILALVNQTINNYFWISCVSIVICVYLTIFYFYGYHKQSRKCKNYERDTFVR